MDNNYVSKYNSSFDSSALSVPMEEHFIKYFLRIKSIKSINTSKNYSIDILQFFKLLDKKVNEINDITIDHVRAINIIHVQNWLLYLTKLSLSSATISRKNHSLSSLYKWLQKFNGVKSNPFSLINDELPKVNSKETEFLSREELQRLMLLFKNDTIKDIRDKAIISLIITTAIRKSELLNIKIKDINLLGNFNLIKIYGKGSKEDYIKLRPDVKKAIDHYLSLTNRTYEDKDKYLFSNLRSSLYDKPLNHNSLNKMIAKRCKQVNINRNITVHSLRHTAITLVVQSNKFSIEQVRDFARHNSIETTNRYIHNKNKFDNYCGDIIQI